MWGTKRQKAAIMSKLFYGVYRTFSSIQIEKIEASDDYKKFSNVVEIEYGKDQNGNGDFYMKIFTQGEFKEIASGNWKVNPLINCSYNWTNEWAEIDVIDINKKESTLSTIIDYRSIHKRNGDNIEGIKGVFRFIASLKDYLNVEHYSFCDEIDKTLEGWIYYDADGVVLKPEEYSEATNKLIKINVEFERLQASVNNPNDFAIMNNLKDMRTKLQNRYSQFIGK